MNGSIWPATAVTALQRAGWALVCTLACTGTVAANEPSDFAVIIHVQNDAPVDTSLLRSAEQETSRVFRQFGVELRWREHRTPASDDVRAPEVSIVLMSAAMGARKSQIEHVADA